MGKRMLKILLKFSVFFILGMFLADIAMVLVSPVNVNKDEIVPYHETVRTDRLYDPEIRLIMRGNGMCSGVVIDDNYALSAAHCATGFFGLLNKGEIDIFNKTDYPTGIKAHWVASDAQRDIALLKGDFKDFNNRRVLFSPKTYPAGVLAACGFPSNSDFYCAPLVIIGNKGFQYRAQGPAIFKGQSGGPVYDQNMNVIGVNSAVSQDSVIISPVIGVDKLWGI